MNKLSRTIRHIVINLALATTVTSLAVAGNPTVKNGTTITVRVLTAKVMKAAKFIGPVAGNVSRGEQLVVAETQGDWFRVTGKFNGWIHRTNVANQAVALSSKPGGNGSGTASKDEIELAGRGFTPQVEGAYKSKNPNLDFAHVDGIESTSIDPSELEAFVNQGRLAGADAGTDEAAAVKTPTTKKVIKKGSK
jgi:uncharacterized protein YgiM (DUF1202 family)